MKKILCAALALVMLLALAVPAMADETEKTTFKIGIAKWVDHASLDQIVESIMDELDALEEDLNVEFDVDVQNCQADGTLTEQIIQNFIADEVDLMVGVATPVALQMQAATEENQIPVVFSAVSDPMAENAALVESLEKPGANITGTSDYLNTEAVLDMIFSVEPDTDLVGLLYDLSQESSATAIAQAKDYLDAKEIEYKEYTGTTIPEIQQAVDNMVTDGVDAAFTPSDNSIQDAELSIAEAMAEGGILHYAGADSFALNGGFLGFGVNYVQLGIDTADMIAQILVDGVNPGEIPVKTYEDGIATVNTDTCEAEELDIEDVEAAVTAVEAVTEFKTVVTADSFDEAEE